MGRARDVSGAFLLQFLFMELSHCVCKREFVSPSFLDSSGTVSDLIGPKNL